MFKKNLWIVALLTALSFTAFMTTSCVDALVVEEDTNTYTYVDIGVDFNTYGGQAYQSGWSTDDASWNDPDHTVKNLGLKLDDFKAARYLELELKVDSLAGALDIIWGNESSGWNQTNSIAPGGASGPLKIDLTKLKGYTNYAASTKQIRIILQYNQPNQVAGLVKSAQLAIPDTPLPPPVNLDLLPGYGAYELPKPEFAIVSGNYEFYMDLNLTRFADIGTSNIDTIPGKVSKDKVEFSFDKADEAVMFEFTDQQKRWVSDAANASTALDVTVTINGSIEGTNLEYRWTLSRAGTSNWNSAGWGGTSGIPVTQIFGPGGAAWGAAGNRDKIDGINFQGRGSNNSKVTVTSIKVTLAEETDVTNFAFTSTIAPVAGAKAVYALDGAQISGTVVWTPAIDTNSTNSFYAGLYKPNTQYTATVTVTPKTRLRFGEGYPRISSFTVTDGFAQYNPATGKITIIYPVTANSDPTAVNISFAEEWLTTFKLTATVAGSDSTAPLQWQFAEAGTGAYADMTGAAATTAVMDITKPGDYRLRATAAGKLPAYGYYTVMQREFDKDTKLTLAADNAPELFKQLNATYTPKTLTLDAEQPALDNVTFTWYNGTDVLVSGNGAGYQSLIPPVAGEYKVSIKTPVFKEKFVDATSPAQTIIVPPPAAGALQEAAGTVKFGADTVDATFVPAGAKSVIKNIGNQIYYNSGDGNYGRAYIAFNAELPDGKTLSDYSKMKFKIQGFYGDLGWKTLSVHAVTSKPGSGDGWIKDPASGDTLFQFGGGSFSIRPQDGEKEVEENIGSGKIVDNNGGAFEVSASQDASDLWFIIRLHNNPSAYKVWDIEFIE